MSLRRSLLALLLLATACSSSGASDDADDSALAADSVDEQALIQKIADASTQQLRDARTKSADGVARRDAHPKAHGCVTAKFTVNANAPEALAVGTFARGKSYDAWIRFSNGSQADDRKDDARGMAIKLLGAAGDKLLDDERTAQTHDIVLSNHHTFFIRSISDYVKFMDAVTDKGNPISFFISANPFDWHLREALLAREFTKQPISSPLTSQYWSVTPYALGSNVVKYTAVPCGGADRSGKHADDANYLSAALKDGLASGSGACFDFAIQTRGDGMSIEDSTITWDEKAAPFVPVARITIPPQSFDSPEQQTYCENLSFTPWHAPKGHEPLGNINRARKIVYKATSTLRHELNGTPRVEPTSLQVIGGH